MSISALIRGGSNNYQHTTTVSYYFISYFAHGRNINDKMVFDLLS